VTEPDDITDILTDQERILMVAWMLPNEGPLTEAQRTQAMGNFADYIRRHNMTPTDVGRQVGSPKATTITELIKGVYRANADVHVRKLNMFIEQHARAHAAALYDKFVSTKVAKDILAVARLVREGQTMGLVIGPTGIGKSRCALAVHEKYVGSIYVRIIGGYHHAKGLTQALAERLNVRTHARSKGVGAHHTQLERVIDILRDSHRLLILDEAHKFTDSAIELLRDIHDTAGVPVLLLATKDLHDRILKNADPDHGQLCSRFDVIHHLTEGHDIYAGGKALYTLQDIRDLYNELPIKLADDAARYLLEVANVLGYGSLRRCKSLLRNAARLARKRQGLSEGEKVTVLAVDLEWTEGRLRRESSEQETVKQRRRQASAAISG
jgi:DNA transposition AAA+ family ATPase